MIKYKKDAPNYHAVLEYKCLILQGYSECPCRRFFRG